MSFNLFKLASLFIFLWLASCKSSNDESVVNIPLNKGWEFRSSNNTEWKPAIVPGDILANLFASKVLSDTQILFRPESYKWIENVGWEYRNSFNVTEKFLSSEFISLQFKGLDTYADVYLNDSLILKANNVFGSWEIPCKKLLKARNNLLYIYFYPLSERNSACGIYKPVILHGWSNAKIENVYFYLLSLSEKEAQYNAEVSILASREIVLNLEILVDEKYVIKLNDLNLKPGVNKQMVSFTIRNPRLWSINGLGKPHLYNVDVRLRLSDQSVDATSTKLGIRKLELSGIKYLADDSLYVKLNGAPVFLKGVAFMSPLTLNPANDSAAINSLLENARIANINFIRVLGQRNYPNEMFYKLCDEKGILLCQDIILSDLMKQDSDQLKFLQHDYTSLVKELRNHPSLAFWYGNSSVFESSKMLADPLNNNQKNYIVNNLIRDNDFKNQYFLFPGNANISSDLINEPYKRLKNIAAIKSCPDKFFNCYSGLNFEPCRILKKFHARDTSTITKIYVSQIMQAEDLKRNIEMERINKPKTMGTIIWQYNDYAPMVSGSIVDYYGNLKPAFYTLMNSYAGVSVVAVRKAGYIEIIGLNDQLKDADAILLCKVLDFSGNDYFVKQIPVTIEANSTKVLLVLKENVVLGTQNKLKSCFLVQLNQPGQTISQNIMYFDELLNIQFPHAEISKTISQSVKGYNIILKSDVLVSNVVLYTSKKDAVFSDNNFFILPGKRYKIQVQYGGTKDELEKDIVINSLNNCFSNP